MASIETFDPDGDLIFIFPGGYAEGADKDTAAKRLKTPKPLNTLKVLAELPEIHMRVSSKHLMLASPVFKAMLSGGFAEGEALRKHGKAGVPLPDDDPVVFTILMDIIHGRSSRVPREVSLDQLAHLAVVIDKYQLQEVTVFYTEAWIEAFDDEFFNSSFEDHNNLTMWLSISWVFRRADIFSYSTARLIHHSNRDIFGTPMKIHGSDQDLPVPDSILGHIQSRREDEISSVYRRVENVIRKYTSPQKFGLKAPNICLRNVACDALALGSLMQSISKEFTFWPDPGTPYENISIELLAKQVKALQIKTMCTGSIPEDYHGIKAEILDPQLTYWKGHSGLDINDYL